MGQGKTELNKTSMLFRPAMVSWLIGSALSGLTCPAYAAEIDRFSLSPEQLFSATVMSVSKTSEKLMDAPAAIYVLTGDDIMRLGATSVPEALRVVPGVNVARVNSSGWAVSVRGFNSTLANKLLVLIDGREVYDPLYSGVYWDIQDMALEDIERIEVIRGPGASLWGANAVNGVINIITKSSADTQGGLVSALAGNQDRAITTGRYGGKFGENGSWRVYGKYLNRDDEKTVTGMNARDGWEEGRGGFRADFKGTGEHRDEFTVQGDVYNSNTGQWRLASFLSAPFTRLQTEDINAHGGNILGRWTRNFTDDSKLIVQSYVDFSARDQLLIRDERRSFDLDAQYELPQFDRHKVIAGGRYRLSDDTLSQTTPTVSFTSPDRTDQLFSAFVQDKITLEEKTWYLTLGSKFEHNDYTGFEIQPNARLQWHPDEEQMVWASVSRAVRTPSRLERDLTIAQLTGAFSFSFNTIGDRQFDSEELIAYELGYRRQITPKLSLDVAAFYNDYDNLSTLTLTSFDLSLPAPLFLNYTYGNQTAGEAYGVETTANWRALESLNLSASHSLLVLALHNPDSLALNPAQPETQSPKYQANLRASWDIIQDVSYDTTLYYVSALSDFQTSSHVRMDMRLGWRITDGLQFDLVGQDLFDPSHREFTSPTDTHVLATDIGRSIYGKLTWRF